MFSIGAQEILLIFIVAVVLISPKDLPRIMQKLGKLMAKIRFFTRHMNNQINDYMDNSLLNDEIEHDEDE